MDGTWMDYCSNVVWTMNCCNCYTLSCKMCFSTYQNELSTLRPNPKPARMNIQTPADICHTCLFVCRFLKKELLMCSLVASENTLLGVPVGCCARK